MVNGKHIGLSPILTLSNTDLFTTDYLSIYLFLTVNNIIFLTLLLIFLREVLCNFERCSDFLNEKFLLEIEPYLVQRTCGSFYLVNRHMTSFYLYISVANY
jgi:hypothetical protein